MDIVDIILAKALTPQGEIETYATLAEKAVADASKAVTDAEKAIDDAEDAIEKADAASDLVEQYADILANFEERVDNEISDLYIDKTTTNFTGGSQIDLTLHYPDGDFSTISAVTKYYNSTGNNTNGTMTQKAITDAIKAGGGGGGGGNIDVTPADSGHFTVVDDEGTVVGSEIAEEDLYDFLLLENLLDLTDVVGLEIDYINKKETRLFDAVNLSAGNDFNKYKMYGGRKRCSVNRNGEITGVYPNITEDGTAGAVMVYQPKFYYKRLIISKVDESDNGYYCVPTKEWILLSDIKKPGFKLHPFFYDANNNPLDYSFFSAYEGSAYNPSTNLYDITDDSNFSVTNSILTSRSGVKPISGQNKTFTLANAKTMASNYGTGWTISNIYSINAQQLLFMVEYGGMNCQTLLGNGCVNLSVVSNTNCSANTGSTSTLGNNSGIASSTTQFLNNTTNTYTNPNTTAISYRGCENIWGNIWTFVDNAYVQLNTTPQLFLNNTYVCDLPTTTLWISNFSYNKQDPKYESLFFPTSNTGNSAFISDYCYGVNDQTQKKVTLTYGGRWDSYSYCGIFCYGWARINQATASNDNTSARLIYQPLITNSFYNSNKNLMEG